MIREHENTQERTGDEMIGIVDLPEVLRLHRLYLQGEPGGKRADLHGANLHGAILHGAILGWTILSEADLRGAILSGAELSGADLRGAILSGADLHKADLRGANLSGANLRGANLSGANLSEAELSGAELRGAKGIREILTEDKRDYRLLAIEQADVLTRFHAGCRWFTEEQALEHWGAADYPEPTRGAMYVIAIRSYMEGLSA